MVKSEKAPYGYIYKVNNIINGKVYIGKTIKTLEERWSEHLKRADALKRAREANPHKKISGTHINNAIIKHGSNAFVINQEDVAYSRAELNEKEQYWVNEYDSINREKGYNMTEGGEGGKKSPEVVEKMTEINQEIARNPQAQEKMSESISEKWQDQKYQESVSKSVTGKWQEPKYRERQLKSRVEGKREIPNKREFLKDIQEMKKKDLNEKHDMDGKCINKRIREMLGHRGVNNFSQAKKYLENKNLEDVLKDINERQNNQSQQFERKKVISNKREFLEDIQNIKSKEIEQKYDMNRSTVNKRIQEMLGHRGVNNYAQAKTYLEDKNLDEVLKDINERLSNQSERYEGQSVISDKKQFLRDIQNMQKNEINYKYDLDGKTINQKIQEILGEEGIRNYSQAKEYLKDKNVEDILNDLQDNNSKELQDKEQSGNGSDDNKQEGRSKDQSDRPLESAQENNEQTTNESKKEPKEVKEPEKEGEKEPTDKQPLDGTTEEGNERLDGKLPMSLGRESIEEISKEPNEIIQNLSDFTDNPLDFPIEEDGDFKDVFDCPIEEKEDLNDVLDGPIEEKEDLNDALDGSVEDTNDLGDIPKDIRRVEYNSVETNDLPDNESIDEELDLNDCQLGPGVPESPREFVGDDQDMLDLS
ncbi:MAG: GIY-YIG nuclease family protein [Promethearchaeota archaeon]